MDDTIMEPPLPEEPQADSFFTRAIGVFISPGRAFESIARRPDFLAPMITEIVGTIVIIEAMLERIGAGRIIRNSLEISGKAAQMTPEQLEQTIQKAAGITAVIMRAAAVIGVPVFLVVIAAVGLFMVNVIFGASTNFKTCFSVVCYADLVLLVGVVLGLVMIFLGDAEQFNPDNFVPTTVGFFLNPRETSKVLYAAASSFDILRVWFIVLSSLGLSVATRKKVGTIAIFLTYLGIWVLIVLGKVGMAVIRG
jgi:hypothetical protein